MKKILAILFAVLMISGTAFAGTSGAPAHVNSVWVGGTGEPGQPIQEYVLVRNGRVDAVMGGIVSGDCLIFDTTSDDAITITRDTTGFGFAGVAVTDIATSDTIVVSAADKSWGYMCIRGYALAQIDVSLATDARPLALNGNTTQGTFGTRDLVFLSNDSVGILIAEPSADGLGKVWIR